MLIPLTRKKFEELVPVVATGDQYKFCWGKPSDVLRRVLISIAAVVVGVIIHFLLEGGFDLIIFPIGFAGGFYWLWVPFTWPVNATGNCVVIPTAVSGKGK
ncbi:hypothetical protein [Egbenema bharatensis]|uniref:hypothetical protein n=1 Tax=Egbenema bharatensis TaxID=3463334 RepID=UPI003A855783